MHARRTQWPASVCTLVLAVLLLAGLAPASATEPESTWVDEREIEGPGWIAYRIRIQEAANGGWREEFRSEFGEYDVMGASCWIANPVIPRDYVGGGGITWTNAAGYSGVVVQSGVLGIEQRLGPLGNAPAGDTLACSSSIGAGYPVGDYWSVYVATAAATERTTARFEGGPGVEIVRVTTGTAGAMLLETDFPAKLTAQADAGFGNVARTQAGIVDGAALTVPIQHHLIGLFVEDVRTEFVEPTVVTDPRHISYVDPQGIHHHGQHSFSWYNDYAPGGPYQFRVDTWVNTDPTNARHAYLIYGDVELP